MIPPCATRRRPPAGSPASSSAAPRPSAALLAFLLAPWLVPLLAPGLGEESGRVTELRSLAVELTRLMLLSPVLFGVSGMVTGILNARQHFLAPALAPLLYNFAIIVGAL